MTNAHLGTFLPLKLELGNVRNPNTMGALRNVSTSNAATDRKFYILVLGAAIDEVQIDLSFHLVFETLHAIGSTCAIPWLLAGEDRDNRPPVGEAKGFHCS